MQFKPKVFAFFDEKWLDTLCFFCSYWVMGLGNSIDFAL
jgi:hypothetical protein